MGWGQGPQQQTLKKESIPAWLGRNFKEATEEEMAHKPKQPRNLSQK